MLLDYLNLAIGDLNELLALTKKDIEDIKEAKHYEIFARAKDKATLITEFETKKSRVDSELVSIVNTKGQSLDEILDKPEKTLIDSLKDKLLELKKVNREYARLVLSVSEFYNSLLERVIPTEMNGYNKVVSSNSYLQVKA